MSEPTDAQEARKAKEYAQKKLQEAQARQGRVNSLAERLSRHLEENHFADRLTAALSKDGNK